MRDLGELTGVDDLIQITALGQIDAEIGAVRSSDIDAVVGIGELER